MDIIAHMLFHVFAVIHHEASDPPLCPLIDL